jgi:hypothetical protein
MLLRYQWDAFAFGVQAIPCGVLALFAHPSTSHYFIFRVRPIPRACRFHPAVLYWD